MYKHPGVYIEHVPSGLLVIEAASTSVGMFNLPSDQNRTVHDRNRTVHIERCTWRVVCRRARNAGTACADNGKIKHPTPCCRLAFGA